MKITNEIKKQKAIELMQKLNIYKPYIHGFETDRRHNSRPLRKTCDRSSMLFQIRRLLCFQTVCSAIRIID